MPIAPDRTRVMLRQRFSKGPTLSALLQLPGASSVITWLVQNWNYQVAQKDYVAVLGRRGGADAAASDLVQLFWKWNEEAETMGQVRGSAAYALLRTRTTERSPLHALCPPLAALLLAMGRRPEASLR